MCAKGRENGYWIPLVADGTENATGLGMPPDPMGSPKSDRFRSCTLHGVQSGRTNAHPHCRNTVITCTHSSGTAKVSRSVEVARYTPSAWECLGIAPGSLSDRAPDRSRSVVSVGAVRITVFVCILSDPTDPGSIPGSIPGAQGALAGDGADRSQCVPPPIGGTLDGSVIRIAPIGRVSCPVGVSRGRDNEREGAWR